MGRGVVETRLGGVVWRKVGRTMSEADGRCRARTGDVGSGWASRRRGRAVELADP